MDSCEKKNLPNGQKFNKVSEIFLILSKNLSWFSYQFILYLSTSTIT